MIRERRLIGSLVTSWVLHVALALVVFGWLLGSFEPPSLAILELVGPPEPQPGQAGVVREAVRRRDTGFRPPQVVPVAPSAESPVADQILPSVATPPSTPRAGGGAAAGEEFSGPRIGYRIVPRYPESARRAGAQGTTVLKARVLADGSVGEVLVEQSAGFPDLDAAAVEAVKGWRFAPARRGGQPVSVWVLIPIRFMLG